jgi:hypothetical protein
MLTICSPNASFALPCFSMLQTQISSQTALLPPEAGMPGNTAKRTYKVADFPAMPPEDTPNVYPADPDWKLQAEARNLEHRHTASLEFGTSPMGISGVPSCLRIPIGLLSGQSAELYNTRRALKSSGIEDTCLWHCDSELQRRWISERTESVLGSVILSHKASRLMIAAL